MQRVERSTCTRSTGSPAIVSLKLGRRFRHIAISRAGLFVALSAISTLAYVITSRRFGSVGFPLDDAWIHQTFARSLAERGEWAFTPGQPSAGSTSPLWTLALSIGYTLGLEYHAWTYVCGGAMLTFVAWLTCRLAFRLRGIHLSAILAGAFTALEWHLVWASASGMETLLFAALALLAFEDSAAWRLASRHGGPVARARWGRVAGQGLVAGLAILTRPDGITLAPFIALNIIAGNKRNGLGAVAARLAVFAIVAGALIAGYLDFNFRLSGALWPNTYYAKQAEYAALRDLPFLSRFVQLGTLPFAGGLAVLAPGILLSAYERARRHDWRQLAPMVWGVVFVTLYAWRLPVTYQHGRYLIPVIPILAAYGLDGLAGWAQVHARPAGRRIASRAWAISLAAVTGAFWLIGARAYARDVQIIETEMVATARWLAKHTPADALLAAHDIGAVGYFARRPILDLAGLVSPEVVGIIRDERALAELIVNSRAEYLMTFPGWYPQLVADHRFRQVYSTGAPFSAAAGGENMAVYRVAPPLETMLYSGSQ